MHVLRVVFRRSSSRDYCIAVGFSLMTVIFTEA